MKNEIRLLCWFKNLVFLIFLSILTNSCVGEDCQNIRSSFSSFSEAKEIVENTNFKIEEKIKTYKSSWIMGAEYRSCDKKFGYLIIETNRKSYIHDDVPYSTWCSFKEANSFGTYYTNFIKGRFRLELNN